MKKAKKERKRCVTCGIPLWMAYLLNGWPWQKRLKPYREAFDCTDLLTEKDFYDDRITR